MIRRVESLEDKHEDARGICKLFADENHWAVCLLKEVAALEEAIDEGWVFLDADEGEEDPYYYVLEQPEAYDGEGQLTEGPTVFKVSLVNWLLAVNEPSPEIEGKELQEVLAAGVVISGIYTQSES